MRNHFFDVLRGYAILLVVMGHVIQNFMPDWENNNIFLFIYSFHMPLFMAISGYFFLKSIDKVDTITFIKKKFQHLMLPSLTMGAINCCIIGGGKILMHRELDAMYLADLFFTGLWFLTVLFILSVLGCVFRKYLKDKMYIGWTVAITAFYFCPDIWLSHELKFLAPFFVGAMALSKLDWNRVPLSILLLTIPVFFVLISHYTFSASMYRMQDDFFTLEHLWTYLFRFSIGLMGCMTSIAMCKVMCKIPYISKSLILIGGVTLPIYAIHQKFIEWNAFVNISISNIYILLIISFIILGLSIVVHRALAKYKIISLFLFGENKI